ncbi:MAG: CDP-alcohol phosphatidyltransferase family protein [Beijerinckiaceae bacterium]|nr:CDP-alcohol phosphatidyltransferase family protein [Beijerinckiaceae bacterium]
MFDARLQGVIQPVLGPAARWLDARGIRADRITLAGFVTGALAVPALAAGAHGVALALILANRIADGLDGAVARLQGPSDRGAFLDIALDFAFYGLVILGFALSDPSANALPAAFLLAAFMGTGSSFLAFAVLAARRGMTSTAFPRKGIYYLGGLTEGAETIAVFVAMCLWPQAFPFLAMLFGTACWITTVMRWRMGWEAFAPRAPQ